MAELPWLDPQSLEFPPTSQALEHPNGLLAAGGDLSPERLIEAYRNGIFPWYEAGQPILWWAPNPRSVILPGKVHISRSLRKTIRSGRFQITADCAFSQVVSACAAPRKPGGGTWITEKMFLAYGELHELGLAHSIEAWDDQGQLAGGLYGVALGGAFFGESMFSRQSDASKAALAALSDRLARWGFWLIDCQVENEHLVSMGAAAVPRKSFEKLLECALLMEDSPPNWEDAFSAENR